MSSVPNRLYAARSPEGVELWIPESEMPSATQAEVLAILASASVPVVVADSLVVDSTLAAMGGTPVPGFYQGPGAYVDSGNEPPVQFEPLMTLSTQYWGIEMGPVWTPTAKVDTAAGVFFGAQFNHGPEILSGDDYGEANAVIFYGQLLGGTTTGDLNATLVQPKVESGGIVRGNLHGWQTDAPIITSGGSVAGDYAAYASKDLSAVTVGGDKYFLQYPTDAPEKFTVDHVGNIAAAALSLAGNIGFYGHAAAAKPTVTGSRGTNAALASLLTGLVSLGLLVDSST